MLFFFLDNKKLFFDNLRFNGNTVIVEHRADEKYAVCQAASVVARKERLEEIRNVLNIK